MSDRSRVIENHGYVFELLKALGHPLRSRGSNEDLLVRIIKEEELAESFACQLLGNLWTRFVDKKVGVEVDWEIPILRLQREFADNGVEVHKALLETTEYDIANGSFFVDSSTPAGPCKYKLVHAPTRINPEEMLLQYEHATYRELIAYARQHLSDVQVYAYHRVVALGSTMHNRGKAVSPMSVPSFSLHPEPIHFGTTRTAGWYGAELFDNGTLYLVRIYDEKD